MRSDSPLSSVNVVLVMAYGSLVFVLLFIFVKRQIMRFAMKSRRGPHVPLGHNAPKELRQEIDSGLSKVQEIRFEPRLLSEQDDRLQSGGCYDYLYRMRALDAIRDSDIPFSELGGTPTAVTGRRFRAWLLDLRSSHSLFCSSRSSLIDTLLEGYHNARHGTGVFGEAEFVKYKEALNELASVVKSHSSSTSLDQHHQLAAKDLTSTPEPTPPSPPPRSHTCRQLGNAPKDQNTSWNSKTLKTSTTPWKAHSENYNLLWHNTRNYNSRQLAASDNCNSLQP